MYFYTYTYIHQAWRLTRCQIMPGFILVLKSSSLKFQSFYSYFIFIRYVDSKLQTAEMINISEFTIHVIVTSKAISQILGEAK